MSPRNALIEFVFRQRLNQQIAATEPGGFLPRRGDWLDQVGESLPDRIAAVNGLKNVRIRASEADIEKTLRGNWRVEHLFALELAVALFDAYGERLTACDRQLESMLAVLQQNDGEPGKAKWRSRARNANRAARALRLAAAALRSSQSSLGAYFRRLCSAPSIVAPTPQTLTLSHLKTLVSPHFTALGICGNMIPEACLNKCLYCILTGD